MDIIRLSTDSQTLISSFTGAFMVRNIHLDYSILGSNNVADRFIFLSNEVNELGSLVTENMITSLFWQSLYQK